MKKAIIFFFCLFFVQELFSKSNDSTLVKSNFLNNLLQFKTDSNAVSKPKTQIVPFPVMGNAPETGFQYGFGFTCTFFLDSNINRTRSSYINDYNLFTTKKQTQFLLQGSIWLPENKWNIDFDVSYTNFPFNFYGIGNDTRQEDVDLITANRFKSTVILTRRIIPNLYIGMGLWFQNDKYLDYSPDGTFATNDYVGKEGGWTGLIGYGMAYDTRDYENSTTSGSYFHAFFWDDLGLGGYQFNMARLDGRHFINLGPKHVIGFNGIYQAAWGSDVPFYYLPSIGGDAIMRGYYYGRYRDSNIFAFQAEYRYRPWANVKDYGWLSASRWSFASFAGAGLAFAKDSFDFNDFKPSCGLGVRYMFEPKSRMTLRFDYGVGSKNSGEDRSQGFYISLNEAF